MNRVVYVSTDPGVPVFGRKGASVHVQAVVRELLRRGAEVHLVTARTGGDVPRGLEGVIVHQLPKISGVPGPERERSARHSALAAEEILAGLHHERPVDLVYERYSLWSDAAMAWARRAGVTGILEVNAPLIDEQATHRVLVARDRAEEIATRAFDAADSVVAVSPPVAAWVTERTTRPHHVHVIANGVDTTHVRPLTAPSPLTGSAPDGPTVAGRGPSRPGPADPGGSGFTVGFVGTLKPWHGVEVLLDAFARLARTDTSTRLRLVGDGPQREALAEQARRLGIAGRVDLVGAVAPEEMPEQLAAMDVAVAPYPTMPNFYFSPLKIYEYLAAGLPVVASDIGPCADLLDGGRLGVLVTPGDATELAAVLAGLRCDGQLRTELGQAARQAAVTRHDWSLVVSRILSTAPPRSSSLADDLLGRIA